jgi:hypothetical protein
MKFHSDESLKPLKLSLREVPKVVQDFRTFKSTTIQSRPDRAAASTAPPIQLAVAPLRRPAPPAQGRGRGLLAAGDLRVPGPPTDTSN